MSLAVVFFNALSGSIAYSKMKRIDYKSGIIFATATIPGSLLGSTTTSLMPRHLFNGVFGASLVIVSIFLMSRSKKEKNEGEVVVGKNYFYIAGRR